MPDRLATQLLRVARDPATGRLHHPSALSAGLRAALFTDLLLAGRLRDETGSPEAAGPAATDDRILDAVWRAVQARPGVPWWRWFRHVHADRAALVGELVGAGRWTARPGARTAYDDVAADEALVLGIAAQRVAARQQAPADTPSAVLAILAQLCGSLSGRPHPRALHRALAPVLDAAVTGGGPEAQALPRMLAGAARTLRRPLRPGG